MKKLVILVVIVAALAGVGFYAGLFSRETTQAAEPNQAPGGQPGAGARGGRGGRGAFGGGPMTVEVGNVKKSQVTEQLMVVGNLIGDATVSVVPKAAGRLQDISVRLGDQVSRGQRIGKIEDQEIQEQVKQAEAAFQVASATIRQRDADLSLALTSVERSRSLYERQLLPKQTLDDNEARYQAAVAQLDLARAQNQQSQARLDELRINLANTVIVAPSDGFVARRSADPGAFVSQNSPLADIVDIRRVRLVVNVVEKDLKPLKVGDMASVDVDAFPGENFAGRIARLAPVLDPATRTAPIEIEINNPTYRLKPGMYARVRIQTGNRKDALVVPPNAVVDVNGRRGVFIATENNTAAFQPVQVGLEEPNQVEIVSGIDAGQRIVTTGASSLADGARFVVVGAGEGRGRAGGTAAVDGASDGPSASTGQRVGTGAQVPEGSPLNGGGRRGRRGGETGAPAAAGR